MMMNWKIRYHFNCSVNSYLKSNCQWLAITCIGTLHYYNLAYAYILNFSNFYCHNRSIFNLNSVYNLKLNGFDVDKEATDKLNEILNRT